MTRKIFILRHAQAAHGSDRDIDRPLTEKGIRDIGDLAVKMNAMRLKPDFCYCSPARRTRQTFDAFMQGCGDITHEYPDDLYNAPTGTLFDYIQRTSSKYQSVMVVAHNPGIHSLAMFLSKQNQMEKFAMGYAPGTLTLLSLEIDDWTKLVPYGGQVEEVLIPGQF